jgi:hypothetical protein
MRPSAPLLSKQWASFTASPSLSVIESTTPENAIAFNKTFNKKTSSGNIINCLPTIRPTREEDKTMQVLDNMPIMAKLRLYDV